MEESSLLPVEMVSPHSAEIASPHPVVVAYPPLVVAAGSPVTPPQPSHPLRLSEWSLHCLRKLNGLLCCSCHVPCKTMLILLTTHSHQPSLLLDRSALRQHSCGKQFFWKVPSIKQTISRHGCLAIATPSVARGCHLSSLVLSLFPLQAVKAQVLCPVCFTG